MFTNLIESQSHRKEFKRRGSFVLFTVAAYAVILFGAGIGSIYAYDAQLEAQASSLEILNWVPPVTPAPPKPVPAHSLPVRNTTRSNAPIDPNITVAERKTATAPVDDPSKVPDHAGTAPNPDPPVTGPVRLTGRIADPPSPAVNSNTCSACSNGPPAVVMTEKAPEPPPVKPPTTLRVPSTILTGKAINLPQPQYPAIARQAHVQGPVSIQILVGEEGKVLSAQIVSGNPMLSFAAKEAAMRARFSPTILNGEHVKVQGVITYNFTLQ
jgi:protein TonB